MKRLPVYLHATDAAAHGICCPALFAAGPIRLDGHHARADAAAIPCG